MLAEVEDEVKRGLGVDTYGIQLPVTIFGKDGGFVFNTVHNIQATVPIDNLIAMFETVKEKGSYSDLKNIIMPS